jgi:hypothetical protein
MPNQVVDIG